MSPEVATRIVSGSAAASCSRSRRLGEEARAEILEGRGRAVEQLQHVKRVGAGLHPCGRRRKIERGSGDRRRARRSGGRLRRSRPARCARAAGSAVRSRHAASVHRWQPQWHVQAAVAARGRCAIASLSVDRGAAAAGTDVAERVQLTASGPSRRAFSSARNPRVGLQAVRARRPRPSPPRTASAC